MNYKNILLAVASIISLNLEINCANQELTPEQLSCKQRISALQKNYRNNGEPGDGIVDEERAQNPDTFMAIQTSVLETRAAFIDSDGKQVCFYTPGKNSPLSLTQRLTNLEVFWNIWENMQQKSR
jgi:hypothetical protein